MQTPIHHFKILPFLIFTPIHYLNHIPNILHQIKPPYPHINLQLTHPLPTHPLITPLIQQPISHPLPRQEQQLPLILVAHANINAK
ncbi:CbiX/SirB N-terminal domain-containing protein, partial [Staphylococcus aureus]|uniref:CbiX/SirB N-terminal domain-containing protein n=1 Tax=Staphylococcus aureus TaxID=1280 RepID=UPI0037DA1EFA